MSNVRIQDDLYHFVNDEWLEKAVIPEDRPTTGGFADLDKGVEELLINDFTSMAKSGEFPDELMANAIALFKVALNEKKRNREGVKPVLKTLARIDKLNSVSMLNRHLKDFVLDDIILPFDFGIEEDMKDTKHYCIMLTGPRTILPDTKYYSEEMAQQKEMMFGLWKNMTNGILAQLGLNQDKIDSLIADTLAFDALIAKYVKSSQEWSEYTKVYNPMTLKKVNSLMKPIKFKKVINSLFGDVEKIIVAEPRYFKAFKEVFNENTFNLYKSWAYVKTMLSACHYLSEDLRNLSGTFMRALTGVKVMPEVKKFAYNLASTYFSEPIGLYYGRKYFGEAAKKDVIEMVQEIVDSYKFRIKRNDFLSEATKDKAILKLEKIGLKMAYPDKCDPYYDLLKVDPSKSLFFNVNVLSRLKREDQFKKLHQEVDHSKWVMPGHMVNACYNPVYNDITFPAAILQPPFYSYKQSRSANLGGIGAVIGHEISHAFDNNGANCDENGNLNNWWTKEDMKKFKQKTKAMIREFEGIELPWGKVNAEFIVSENIADNGGMAATLEIMKNMKDKNYEEYFMNWARVWCLKAKPEYLSLLLTVDVHAPTILRANMQVRNFPEWYETFNVKKSDKMYIAPNKRVIIW